MARRVRLERRFDRHGVRATLLDVFAEHPSESVQHTLHAMGQAVLDTHVRPALASDGGAPRPPGPELRDHRR